MADNKTLWTWGNQQKYHEELQSNIDSKISTGGYTIDSELSETSENAVQNKVVTDALNNKANKDEIPTTLPANGGTAAEVNSATGKAKLYETSTEGGNLRLTSPDGTLYMEEDCYNNTTYRKYVVKDGANKAIEYYNSTTNTNEIYPITKVKSAGDATQAQVRNLSSGTAAASTTNCPSGAWYGQHS